jgi:hypothetical protein
MYVFFCGFANIAHEKGDDFFQLIVLLSPSAIASNDSVGRVNGRPGVTFCNFLTQAPIS